MNTEKFDEKLLANNTIEHVAAAGIDSNSKFKWSDNLVQDFLKALSNFETVMVFQYLDICICCNKGSLLAKFNKLLPSHPKIFIP